MEKELNIARRQIPLRKHVLQIYSRRDILKNFFRILDYLLRMVQSFLRELLYETTEEPRRKDITGGSIQGSILVL